MASNSRAKGNAGGGDETPGNRQPKTTPSHRGTRYKEKFQMLREKYDQVNALHQEYERDLGIANQKLRSIQAENDLLLDAIYITLSASQPSEEHVVPAPVPAHPYHPHTPPHHPSRHHPSHHQHPNHHNQHSHQRQHHHHRLPPPPPSSQPQQHQPPVDSQQQNHALNGTTNGNGTPNGTSRHRHGPTEPPHDGLREYSPHEMNGRG
ncbi:hypothetical protein SERLA73DRAFT_192079 [Serpula lacrymans var. lacrymans S7.3]|uniref:Uncharacterized protein n=1 Tax=Serpula lacrymans var. lacrymans (strain S7.3) TaxID=936435 RepID=F8QIX8_SERL3|nr:hypothetical protein SERLA73DRAFT_192079 [Serpula lacrymans var. lacrymans S7.3]